LILLTCAHPKDKSKVCLTLYDDKDNARICKIDLEMEHYEYAAFTATNQHHPESIYLVLATQASEIKPARIFKFNPDTKDIKIDNSVDLKDPDEY